MSSSVNVLSDVVRDAGGMAVRCEGVVHIYRLRGNDVVAVRGVDLEVGAGEKVALLGPSGSGKSTLLNLLGGLLRPSAGRLFLGDNEVNKLTERDLLRLRATKVGTVLQGASRNLLPYASPEQNVRFAQSAVSRQARRGLLAPMELLEVLGLHQVARKPIQTLSGGEQQRVALAVGVANGPGLLLADEPTSQLDHEARLGVLEMLETVNGEFGTTIVLVTHDPDVSHRLGRTVHMRNGAVGAEGHLGERYSVISKGGSVHLADELLPEWPPGTLVTFERESEDIVRIIRRSR
jgi:ABC-type lipoprotein export system ATPase subunit